ncbi:YCF48-related protein [Pseudomonas sp. NFACC13-1]|uniref:WD40/YVTN/BNR-like repeat-containing protein n=1 Tax=Pseudomonas sp. NFACC13-1 TaxID=1566245 RepID=UPI0015A3FFA1|nr:YCF48-related protein [Pseudomonas sp. NFACC13-1]
MTLALCLTAACNGVPLVCAQGFADPLDTPAEQHADDLANLPIQAMARAGDNLVAVGMRGVILQSSDGGGHWRQVAVPVSSDLLDVSFLTPSLGWAVGQDGVILISTDGGSSWRKQFDGRQLLTQFKHYYQESTGLDPLVRDSFVQQLETNFAAGPVLPFFAVHFVDFLHGLAVGPFGTLVASDDGGKHWRPALQQIDNPEFLHLNAIAQVGDQLFITSEQGIVFKADVNTRQFRRIDTGHTGSFFSIAGHDRVIVAGGLGGVLYGSHDQGETWSALRSPLKQLVTRVGYNPLQQGFFALTAQGEVLVLSADLSQMSLRKTRAPMLYTDATVLADKTLYAGIQGLREDPLTTLQVQRGEQP